MGNLIKTICRLAAFVFKDCGGTFSHNITPLPKHLSPRMCSNEAVSMIVQRKARSLLQYPKANCKMNGTRTSYCSDKLAYSPPRIRKHFLNLLTYRNTFCISFRLSFRCVEYFIYFFDWILWIGACSNFQQFILPIADGRQSYILRNHKTLREERNKILKPYAAKWRFGEINDSKQKLHIHNLIWYFRNCEWILQLWNILPRTSCLEVLGTSRCRLLF